MIGIDIFAPTLELARANISAANLDERVELRQQYSGGDRGRLRPNSLETTFDSTKGGPT